MRRREVPSGSLRASQIPRDCIFRQGLHGLLQALMQDLDFCRAESVLELFNGVHTVRKWMGSLTQFQCA